MYDFTYFPTTPFVIGSHVLVSYIDYDENGQGSGKEINFEATVVENIWSRKKIWLVKVKDMFGKILDVLPNSIGKVGKTYHVRGYTQFIRGKETHCSCPAWTYNKTRPCKHIKEVLQNEHTC